MRGGTLFSGIGAPECAMPWIDWRWAAEIDPFASAVHAARFPGVVNLGDVTKVDADAVEPVDLVVFGSPCQSFSVAGKRLGLDDPRGNLTLVGIRLISKLKPRYVVWENVPGVLSDDDGKTVQTVIELFTQIGYVCDIDIWDAQHFGVPQRRRRVFVTCVLLDDLMRARTPISERIMGDLLVQALLATWGAALEALSPEPGHSVFASQIKQPAGSPQKKMRSLDDLLGGSAVTRLLDFWAGSLAPSMGERPSSALTSRPQQEPRVLGSKTATDGCPSSRRMASGSGGKSTELLPRWLWEDLWTRASSPTTLISTSLITSLEICSFARLALSIVQSTINSPHSSLSRPWSSDYWSLAFYSLTLTKDIIDYARSASCELFSTSELRAGWGDNLDAARSCRNIIERRIGAWGTSSQVLSFAENLRGNTAPRREAGQRTARPIGSCPAGGSGYRNDADTAENLIAATLRVPSHGATWRGDGCDNLITFDHQVAGSNRTYIHDKPGRTRALTANKTLAVAFSGNRQSGPIDVATAVNAHGGPHGRLDFESETFVTHSLRADGFDTGEDGTGRGTPLVVAFHENQRAEVTFNNIAGSLKVGGGKPGQGYPALQQGMLVRRLTPTECEKLQGFPPGWSAIQYRGKPAADGPRYRAIGNSMAVPVIGWIGHRVQLFESAMRSLAGGRAA